MTTNSKKQTKGLSSEELAKKEGVEPTAGGKEKSHQLVAVIKGELPNQNLLRGIELIKGQRARLASLSKQFDVAPVGSVQQRELLAREINQARQSLELNLRKMGQSFGYSLDNHYLLIPHISKLVEEAQSGETPADPESLVVHTFETPDSFKDFQERRNSYLKLKSAAIKEQEPESDESPSDVRTPEMAELSQGLMDDFKYDPEKNYSIRTVKAALYARSVR